MDALDPAATALRLFDDKRNLHFFPIRHHSPACAVHLRDALREIRPAVVLIEGPVDFEPLARELLAPGVVPPVAIVALPHNSARAKGGRAGTTYYPICRHSPEYVALQEADALGATIRFIDLPARHPAMLSVPGTADGGPLLPMRETALNRGAYVEALCKRAGFRDGHALWDGLFEARARTARWRDFFASVGAYCAALRAASTIKDLESDGTLEREAMMRACIVEALAAASGTIAIVTGGFHTPALIDASAQPSAMDRSGDPESNAWLIRYDFRSLDRLNGYAAGLPLPGYYDRVWQRLTDGDGLEGDLTDEILVGFRAYLSKHETSLIPSFPTLRDMVETARRLAALRGLPAAGRSELFDAVRASAIKEEIEAGGHPLLAALTQYLQGTKLGHLPPGSRLPPLIERARREAQSHRLSLDDALPRDRELDIYRKPSHQQASRFLHAMRLIAPSFAERLKGPDRVHGFRANMLLETWRYAWSPVVEAALLEQAANGDSVAQAATAVLMQRLDDLQGSGDGNNAQAALTLLNIAFDAGIGAAADRLAAVAGVATSADGDLLRLANALVIARTLENRAKGHRTDVNDRAFSSLLRPLVTNLIRRIAELLHNLTDVRPGGAGHAINCLQMLAETLVDSGSDLPSQALRGAVTDLLAVQLDPAVGGAVIALATLAGIIDKGDAGKRLAAALAGAFEKPGEAIRTLSGVMALAPHLVVNDVTVIAEIDRLFGAVDDQGFLLLLPQLRMAFAELSPQETDKIAALVAAAHGVGNDALVRLQEAPGARTLADHLALNEKLRAQWQHDGLAMWLEKPT